MEISIGEILKRSLERGFRGVFFAIICQNQKGVIVGGIIAKWPGAPSALAVGCNVEANRSSAKSKSDVASGLGRDEIEGVT